MQDEPKITAACLRISNVAPEVLDALVPRARHTVAIEAFGTSVAVNFEDPSAAALLARRYAPFLRAGAAAQHLYAVRSPEHGPRFWGSSGSQFVWPLGAVSETYSKLADALAMDLLFRRTPATVSFHAGAVQIGSAAAEIAGMTTSGKTTTTLACVRRGMPLYSDERCVVRNGMVLRFPRALNVRPHSAALLSAEAVAGVAALPELHDGTGDDYLLPADAFGRAAPRPLAAVFFITGRSDRASVAPMSKNRAVPSVVDSLFLVEPPLDLVGRAVAILQRVPVFALTLGSPDESAQAVIATVRELEQPSGAEACA